MLQDIVLCVLFVGGTVLLTLAAYFLMRRVAQHDPEDKNSELRGSIIGRIAALHGVILALVFAQELIDYQQLKSESATEAAAIADIYYDAERYGLDASSPIPKAMAEYVRVVIAEEWSRLGAIGRLSPAAWAQWDIAYRGVLDLVPASDRQKSLRDHMLSKIHVVSDSRVRRESNSINTVSAIFWFAAILGVVFIAFSFYTHPPGWLNLSLISMFGGYMGIIIFFIYAFSNPYSPPAKLNPGAFERLLEQIGRSSPAPAPAVPRG